MCDVLVLEDDVLLCETTADVLTDEGFSVRAVCDTVSALEVLRNEGARVLVADRNLVRPNDAPENGHAFALAVSRSIPGLNIVFVTGERMFLADAEMAATDRKLYKPYLPSELVQTVRGLLA